MNVEYESKITILLEHINNFRTAKNNSNSEIEKRYGLPMILFQIINYTIDLSDILISIKRLGFPTKYSDNFEILFNYKIISKDLKEDLQKLCEYRNMIAHEYHRLNKEEYDEIAELIPSVTDFITIIEQNVK